MKHFETLSSYSEYLNIPQPEHPRIMVVDLKKDAELLKNRIKSSPPITNDFYLISMKKVITGAYKYGRTNYDFEKGAMIFTSPNQVLAWDNVELDEDGYAVTFHKDFLNGHKLASTIKSYDFFSYSANEALHLSPKEQLTIESIYQNIYKEYHANPDDFSANIIQAHIDTLLQYALRFYNRQFIHRKEHNLSIIKQLNYHLKVYLEIQTKSEKGIPTVEWLANELQLSQKYLNSLLKKETGKTTLENIHLFLIDEAKNRLLEPNNSVSDVAYSLGFAYPQYFSRLFKKIEGITPKEFSNLN